MSNQKVRLLFLFFSSHSLSFILSLFIFSLRNYHVSSSKGEERKVRRIK